MHQPQASCILYPVSNINWRFISYVIVHMLVFVLLPFCLFSLLLCFCKFGFVAIICVEFSVSVLFVCVCVCVCLFCFVAVYLYFSWVLFVFFSFYLFFFFSLATVVACGLSAPQQESDLYTSVMGALSPGHCTARESGVHRISIHMCYPGSVYFNTKPSLHPTAYRLHAKQAARQKTASPISR